MARKPLSPRAIILLRLIARATDFETGVYWYPPPGMIYFPAEWAGGAVGQQDSIWLDGSIDCASIRGLWGRGLAAQVDGGRVHKYASRLTSAGQVYLNTIDGREEMLMTDKTQMVLQAAAGKYILKATDRQMIIHYVDKNWRSILIGSLSGCSDIELAERAMGIWREG